MEGEAGEGGMGWEMRMRKEATWEVRNRAHGERSGVWRELLAKSNNPAHVSVVIPQKDCEEESLRRDVGCRG